MSTEKKWICPKCSEEFGGNYLRCPCGYEGSPVYSNRTGLFNEYDKLKGEKTAAYEQYPEIKENYFSAEDLIRRSEIEHNKLKEKIDATERLKRKLNYSIYKLNEIIDKDSYKILGVHKTDTIESIHKKYKAILSIYHPDKHSDSTEDSIKQKNNYISEINGAYKKILKTHKEN